MIMTIQWNCEIKHCDHSQAHMRQSLPQHCLGCCLPRLLLMETQVCSVLPHVHSICPSHYLRCCLRRLRLKETLLCGVRCMSTVHSPVTAPAVSEILPTALAVNGNTSPCGVCGMFIVHPQLLPQHYLGRLRLYGNQA